VVTEVLGFPTLKPTPSKERFSHFLRCTPNEELQVIRLFLVHQLIQEGVITGKYTAIDSCAIKANVKENNFKTSAPGRYDKVHIPSGDPEARMGMIVHYGESFEKKVNCFWGYRNHILNDAFTELPIHEVTWPADKDEKKQAIPLLKEAREYFALPTECVIGDANYDTEEILSYIFYEMKAMPVIPKNPRRLQADAFQIKRGVVLCPANLQMHRKGRMTVKGKTYLQYTCPLYWGNRYQGKYLLCPAGHPKFISQKGCNYLLRLTPSVREHIAYGTKRFRLRYNRRTSAERVFSRLLSITMQRPTVIGLLATKNHCTIAHMTVLLIALTAHRMGYENKIRYVKSFLPKFCL